MVFFCYLSFGEVAGLPAMWGYWQNDIRQQAIPSNSTLNILIITIAILSLFYTTQMVFLDK